MRIFKILLFLFFPFYLFAQNAEVRGFLYNKKNGEPVIFNTVFLKGTKFNAQTDVNGFYSITNIKPGTYLLMTQALGYDSSKLSIQLVAGQKLNQNIYLDELAVDLTTVNITAEKEEKKSEVNISVNKVSPKQIKQLPTIGGEPDLAQYLQVVPGVVFTGDQGGQLYIRGGSPVQNKVLLDGMTIYNPFHSIGLFSVFDTDLIRNVDVYSGGFNAEYGGRISAVLDVTTRDGNRKRFGGKISSNPFTSKIILEGPFSKFEENKTNSSFIISCRTSYLEQSSKLLYSYADKNGLPYNFTDIYAKASLNGSSGNKINFFGFNFADQVNYTSPAALKWNSYGIGSNFVVIPSGSSVLVNGSFSFSDYKIQLQQETQRPRISDIQGFQAALNFSYFLGNDALKYGINIAGYSTNYLFTNGTGIRLALNDNTTELAGYLKYKIARDHFIIEPGIRAHYYTKQQSELSFEPRIGLKFLINDHLRLKAAGGFFAQNLLAGNSDKDVVNLFYGFISSPDDLPGQFDGQTVNSGLQKATHLIGGIEYDFLEHFEFNIEPYWKYFDQLININPYQIYSDDYSNADKPDYQKKSFIFENGTAKGIDFLLKYDYKRLYIWMVYSLGYINRYDGIQHYNPNYDRRHNINLVSSYNFGKNASWQVSMRWNFGSGFPFTQNQGFYEKLNFNQGGIGADYTKQNGNLTVIYGELNKGRLPYYHRMDVSIKKTWNLRENIFCEANAGATNIYNRQNIFYYDRITNTRKNQLPILPTIGISLTF